MAPSSEERREVAERLMEAAIDDGHTGRPYGEQGFQVTLRRIIGTSNPTRPTLYSRLADLIDPTCKMEAAGDVPALVKDNLGTFFCSECGSPIYNDSNPSYCLYCGARVVDDE